MEATTPFKHLGTFKDFNDGSIKCVYETTNGIIETTLINNKNDNDIDVYCVPTHHFCNLGCVLCHLTARGIKKGMVPIGQKDFIEALVRTTYKKSDQVNISKPDFSLKRTTCNKCLISFMGVGEPLLNLDLVKDVHSGENSIKKACNYNVIGYALSTIIPNKKLGDLTNYVLETKFPVKVHFSLHSPFSDERIKLLPFTSVGVEEALEMLCEYRNKLDGISAIKESLSNFHASTDPIEIHYTLIQDHNDSNRHLDKLLELLNKYKIPIKFLRFNPIGELKRSNNGSK